MHIVCAGSRSHPRHGVPKEFGQDHHQFLADTETRLCRDRVEQPSTEQRLSQNRHEPGLAGGSGSMRSTRFAGGLFMRSHRQSKQMLRRKARPWAGHMLMQPCSTDDEGCGCIRERVGTQTLNCQQLRTLATIGMLVGQFIVSFAIALSTRSALRRGTPCAPALIVCRCSMLSGERTSW